MMEVTVATSETKKCTLFVKGKFDLSSHREFKEGYEAPLRNEEVKEIEIDLGEVDYIDASALGMLLILKERASSLGKRTSLARARGATKTTLDIANFGKLFPMRE